MSATRAIAPVDDEGSSGARGFATYFLAGSSAFLAGAAGLGIQAILAASASLAFGAGTGPALALATFLSFWALGAWVASRPAAANNPRPTLGFAAIPAAPAATLATIHGGPWAAVVGIAIVAFLQGLFLPILARGLSSRAVGFLLALNLAGAWFGAFGIADAVVRASGYITASVVAWFCAFAAVVFGIVRPIRVFDVASTRSDAPADADSAGSNTQISALAGALVVGLGTAWMGGVEWSLVRLGSLWFGGMQDALSAVLAASIAALALGAAVLPPILPRGARGVAIGLILCAASSTWILGVHEALPHLASEALWIRALVLCVPALAPFGALVPLVHRASRGESGARLGRLYLHESWGAWIGIPLVQFVLTPKIGLAASVGFTAGLGAIAALALARRARFTAPIAAAGSIAAAVVLALAAPPALRSPALANPAFRILSFHEDRDFAVSVVDDGLLGERTLMTDGFRAAGTGRDYRYMRVLGHLPLLLHPNPERVAVLALGTGTTVGAVSLHAEVKRIDVLEIARAVVEAAPLFPEHNRGALAEGLPGLLDANDGQGRVVVRLGDGRKTLRDSPATYDVVTMEPLLPDSPFGVHLYTKEAYEDVKRALKPGGIVCQWVPPHALESRTYVSVVGEFVRSFPFGAVFVSGTQVALVGAERPIEPDARRLAGFTDGDLRDELESLGLADPTSIAARCTSTWPSESPGDDSDRGAGPTAILSDSHPWIAYRPRRVGPILLLDLKDNLPRNRAVSKQSTWLGEDTDLARGLVALRSARRSHAEYEAYLRSVPGIAQRAAEEMRGHVVRANELAPNDPEVRAFTEEIDFLDDLRAGVAALAADSSREAAIAALEPLTRAAQARTERADVHAYVAAALSRAGSPTAAKAWDAALARCPRLAETDAGKRARDLGLAPDLWERAQAAARIDGVTSRSR